jgi:hypothetical protein
MEQYLLIISSGWAELESKQDMAEYVCMGLGQYRSRSQCEARRVDAGGLGERQRMCS